MSRICTLALAFFILAACAEEEAPETATGAATADSASGATASQEIVPGLSKRVLKEGSGEAAVAGQTAVVHYTGWLHDPDARNLRGEKFDSSVDRNQHFRFVVGAGHVIQGWDRGVAGMQVGEKAELTIAPELAYGDSGAGEVIPPNSTLVFEVELAALEGEPAAE